MFFSGNRKKLFLWLKVCLIVCVIIVLGIGMRCVNRGLHPVRAAVLPCRDVGGDARSVNVNGFDLWYRERGNLSGEPVIILHGGPAMSGSYFGDSFGFLEKDYRVIIFDQRGSGNSQIKPDLSLYTFHALIEDLETIRKDVVGCDKFILVGHSFGGVLAQAYAFTYPQHVDRLILVSPGPAKLNHEIKSRPVKIIQKYGLPPSDPLKANEYFMRTFETIFKPTFYDPEIFARFSPGYASYGTYSAIRASLGDYDFSEEEKKITAPTLILYGGVAEINTCVEKYQIVLNELIPNSKRAKLEKSGHWSFLEEPEKFQQSVKDFLNDRP